MENDIFYLSLPDDWFRWLFWMTVSDARSKWLFRMTVWDDYFGWLFWMPISDDCSRWLFRMPISDDFSRWLFVIRILSTNYSADWSHDWLVFERRLPTVELWPRSPLIHIPLPEIFRQFSFEIKISRLWKKNFFV